MMYIIRSFSQFLQQRMGRDMMRTIAEDVLFSWTSYPSPADLESLGSKLSDVIEQAESGDIG